MPAQLRWYVVLSTLVLSVLLVAFGAAAPSAAPFADAAGIVLYYACAVIAWRIWRTPLPNRDYPPRRRAIRAGTSAKKGLLECAAMFGGLGVFLVGIGVSRGEAVGAFTVVLGALLLAAAAAGVVATMLYLKPSTRLPEHLRDDATDADGRRTPVDLELSDGGRITRVVVRPGGYVIRRRNDPVFDARDVVTILPPTQTDVVADRGTPGDA